MKQISKETVDRMHSLNESISKAKRELEWYEDLNCDDGSMSIQVDYYGDSGSRKMVKLEASVQMVKQTLKSYLCGKNEELFELNELARVELGGKEKVPAKHTGRGTYDLTIIKLKHKGNVVEFLNRVTFGSFMPVCNNFLPAGSTGLKFVMFESQIVGLLCETYTGGTVSVSNFYPGENVVAEYE